MATREMMAVYRRRAYLKDPEKSKAYHRAWGKAWRTKHPEASRLAVREAYHKDVDKSRRLARESRARMKLDPVRLENSRRYAREKMRRLALTNPNHSIRKKLRTRICMALKRQSAGPKSASTMTLIGCSVADFKKYIESLWKRNMSWLNYSKRGWHVDHIKPCSSFDLTDPEQQKICFHYTNLQPLWWDENLRKGDR